MKRIFQGFVVLLFLPLFASAQFTRTPSGSGALASASAQGPGDGQRLHRCRKRLLGPVLEPAGLTQSQLGEFSFGLSYRGADDKSTFLPTSFRIA